MGGPFPIILILEFLQQNSMVVDLVSKRLSINFTPNPSVQGSLGTGVKGRWRSVLP